MTSGGSSGKGLTSRPATLAGKLNYLMANVRVDGALITNEAVAEAVSRLGEDYRLSAVYLKKLRSGEKANPSMRVLQGLAKAFGIPASYFTDDTDAARELHERLPLLIALREKSIDALALRASRLPPESIQALIEVVNAMEIDEAERGS